MNPEEAMEKTIEDTAEEILGMVKAGWNGPLLKAAIRGALKGIYEVAQNEGIGIAAQ